MKKKLFLAVALLALMAVGAFAQTDPGAAWRRGQGSPFSGTDRINDVAFGSNTFVAVGNGGKMAWSSDGRTWTAVANSTFGTSNINAVAFGGSRFVAVGDAGKAAYSTDGRTWTAANTFFDTSNILDIVFGNNRFIAVGRAGKMAYSANGQQWTTVSVLVMPTRNDIVAIAWGSNKFVITDGTEKMWYSGDTDRWTAVQNTTFSADSGEILGIAWANNMFFAVGKNGDNSNSKMAYSSDGVTWTAVTGFPSLPTDLYDVAFGAGRYIAIASHGLFYSTDNVTWRYINDYSTITGTGSANVRGIAFGANRFVIVGMRGTLAYLE